MRFQETANRNQFEAAFPVQSSACKPSHTTDTSSASSSANSLSNNIINNNNFIRQQRCLFSNSKCNAGKSMLSIKEVDPNFTIKNKQLNKSTTINKKASKHFNLSNDNDCYVTQMKTASGEKNSALSRLLSKMTNQSEDLNKINGSNMPPLPPNQQKVSFF